MASIPRILKQIMENIRTHAYGILTFFLSVLLNRAESKKSILSDFTGIKAEKWFL